MIPSGIPNPLCRYVIEIFDNVMYMTRFVPRPVQYIRSTSAKVRCWCMVWIGSTPQTYGPRRVGWVRNSPRNQSNLVDIGTLIGEKYYKRIIRGIRMTEAERKLVEIIEKVEHDSGLPSGILKMIYQEELVQVHKDKRTNVEKSLRELIMKYFSQKR